MATNSSWHMGLAKALLSRQRQGRRAGGMCGGMRQKQAAIHKLYLKAKQQHYSSISACIVAKILISKT